MSTHIQLEFNIENKTPTEMHLSIMQKQIDAMNESVGKVRRKLFAEMGEVKKLFAELQKENEVLKKILKELNGDRTEWSYGQNGCLFDVQEHRQAVS